MAREISRSGKATINVEEGVEVRLYLSDAAIEQTKTIGGDISLCLINRENGDGTAFVPFANSIEVYDSHGDVVDDITFAGAVDENGKLVINLVPEPTKPHFLCWLWSAWQPVVAVAEALPNKLLLRNIVKAVALTGWPLFAWQFTPCAQVSTT